MANETFRLSLHATYKTTAVVIDGRRVILAYAAPTASPGGHP